MLPLTDDETIALVRAAVAAPSADNRHVVRFERRGATLRLRVEGSALEGVPSHRIAFYELAFGAIIENLVLAAGAMGREAVVRRYPMRRDDLVIADIEFIAGSIRTADPLHEAIFERTTNRRLYNRRQRIPKETLEDMAKATRTVGDVRVRWLDEPHARSRALAVVLAAERERFRRERLHSELFDAIRFDVGWRASVEEGLPPAALEIEPPFRPLFHALRRWKLQRGINVLGAAQLLGLRAAWLPAWSAPHVLLLTVPHADTVDFIDAGRALQRLWLCATRHSVAMQPMAASIAIALQSPDEGWVPEAVASRIRSQLEMLVEGRRAVMIARVGYASEPSNRTGRRAAQSYMVEHSD